MVSPWDGIVERGQGDDLIFRGTGVGFEATTYECPDGCQGTKEWRNKPSGNHMLMPAVLGVGASVLGLRKAPEGREAG